MDPLKLENQLCFPLYAAAKEITRKYRPFLEPLGLTYTQYIAMMVMWEHGQVSAGKMGELLMLDSGTLTPMLKKMEAAGLVTRKRNSKDERELIITITPKGKALREQAEKVPSQMASCVDLSLEEALTLKTLLNKLLK